MFWDTGLEHDGGSLWIYPGSQPVGQHVTDIFLDTNQVSIVGCEYMQVSNEEEALVGILKIHPTFQRTR